MVPGDGAPGRYSVLKNSSGDGADLGFRLLRLTAADPGRRCVVIPSVLGLNDGGQLIHSQLRELPELDHLGPARLVGSGKFLQGSQFLREILPGCQVRF